MTYSALLLVLSLAAFGFASAAAALGARWLWPRLGGRLATQPTVRRARALAALRLLPSASGALVAGGLVVPAYLAHEPQDAGESPGLVLVAFAGIGAAFVATALARLLASWRATRRLLAEWRPGAEPLGLPGAPAPAFRARSAFPVVAAVGLLRPRLFLAGQVLDALDEDERDAVLAHEAGHLVARDNLTGLLLRACPDGVLWGRAAADVEVAWREAVEQAADEQAARGGPRRAASLASALVKVARMVPEGMSLSLPAPGLHDGEAVGARVERLLRLSRRSSPRRPQRPRREGARRLAWSIVALALVPAALPPTLARVHTAIEHLVRALP